MALVSSLLPIHLRHTQMGMRPIGGFSRTTSSRSSWSQGSSNLLEIEEEDKVYVAVGKDFKEGKENLIWVLQITSREKMIVIVHVHRPSQTIPMMGAKFPASQLEEKQVRAYRQLERGKMNKHLDEYLTYCSISKVPAEKLVIEMDDVAKGLVELIAQHRIANLVMGAAANKNYSKKMKALKSRTAISVQRQADPSCKIWFVCKGNLICTRDTDTDGSGIPRSPTDSLSSRSDQSIQLRSRSLNWPASPISRSRSDNFVSPGGGTIEALPLATSTVCSSLSTKGSISDHCEGISSSSFHPSDHSTPSMNMDCSSISRDEEGEEGSVILPSVCESEEYLEEIGIDNKLYEKLTEAENLKHEAYKESCRRQKAERDAIEADRKAKASHDSYTKELKKRKETEATLAREKIELEKLKNQRDEVIEELQRAQEQKLEMELRIADSDRIVKDFEEKLSTAKNLLSSLQREYEELQRERDDAIREGEELHQKKEEATTSTRWAANFSEFTIEDLERATNNFDDSRKIGEGGYGSVYKGSLGCTDVAIKMLNPQSRQGQSEFNQEVEILSRVRHPHLITLIGTCPEAWALIYEYLPKGSLEDRLLCRDNTRSLSWQVRTRIAAEICSALIFLHSKPHTVVHGDLKPANILLDANFVSKLGDFGICRLLVQSDTTITLYRHTQPKGTLGYMDPEFVVSGELTPHSDVTGRREALGIIKEVQGAMEEGRLHEVLDVSAGDWPFVQAKQLAHLALGCCKIERKSRPDLAGEVWRVLEPMMKAASSVGSPSSSSGSGLNGRSCIPSYFMCPIFQEIMKDPHIAADGFTYEIEALNGCSTAGTTHLA